MTTAADSPRRAPTRRAFALAGLVAILATAWRDRDLVAVFDVSIDEEASVYIPPRVPAGVEPVERLRRAIERVEAARAEYLRAFDDWPRRADMASRPVDDPLWKQWAESRARAWPAQRDTLEALVVEALRAAQEEPGNGVHALVAGLAEVRLSISPSSLDLPVLQSMTGASDWIARTQQVLDPARLAAGLERIDEALAAPAFTFHTGELISARMEHVEGTPLVRFIRGLAAGAAVDLPEAGFLRPALADVARLAARERLQGEPHRARANAERARRAALRLGSGGSSLMELLVASAALSDADREWLALGVQTNDQALVIAASAESRGVREEQDRACAMGRDEHLQRLSTIDRLMMPAGGWGGAVDMNLGRRMEHAVVDSLLLLRLMAVALVGLAHAAWRGRWAASADHPAAGFTLGDALGVALPGLVGAAVFGLASARLNPWRERLGLGYADSGYVVLLQTVALVAGGAFVHAWLLRRTALARHGLAFARPALANAGLGLALGGVALATQWTAPAALEPGFLGVALLVAGYVCAMRGGALGRAAAAQDVDRAVRGYAGRTGIATLGLALVVLAGLEVFVVAPRRDALASATGAQYARLLSREAESWGDGRPRGTMTRLLAHSPAAPIDPASLPEE